MSATHVPILAFVAAALLGCAKGKPPAETTPPETNRPSVDVEPARRRATAGEIVEAAQSGVTPDWFSAEEAAAVRKLTQ